MGKEVRWRYLDLYSASREKRSRAPVVACKGERIQDKVANKLRCTVAKDM
jgi:hypothetical protein